MRTGILKRLLIILSLALLEACASESSTGATSNSMKNDENSNVVVEVSKQGPVNAFDEQRLDQLFSCSSNDIRKHPTKRDKVEKFSMGQNTLSEIADQLDNYTRQLSCTLATVQRVALIRALGSVALENPHPVALANIAHLLVSEKSPIGKKEEATHLAELLTDLLNKPLHFDSKAIELTVEKMKSATAQNRLIGLLMPELLESMNATLRDVARNSRFLTR